METRIVYSHNNYAISLNIGTTKMKKLISRLRQEIAVFTSIFAITLGVAIGVAVAQDPGITVQFDSDGVIVNEADGTAVLTVRLSAASTDTITVQYATEDDTAISPDDYTAATDTLIFEPGETEKQIIITIINDTAQEDTEWAWVKLSNPQNATLGTRTDCYFSIIDDDTPPQDTIVRFEASSWTFNESDGTVEITVRMMGSPTSSVSVTCSTTTGGSAVEGVDYYSNSATLSWSPSEAWVAKTFTISLIGNSIIDGTRTVNLELTDPSNASLGDPATATLNILDDDASCPPIVE